MVARHHSDGRLPTSRSYMASAEPSVSDATWSMTTRSRAASSRRVAPVGGEHRLQVAVPGGAQRGDEGVQDLALALVDGLPVFGGHHEGGGQALHHGDLHHGLIRDDQLGVVAGQVFRAVDGAGGLQRALAEPADELAGHVLERRHGLAAAVGLAHPDVGGLQPGQGGVDRGGVVVRQVPLLGVADHAGAVVRVVHPAQLEVPGDDRVLDVVHRVGDVVGEVHDLRLEAGPALRGALADPVEDGQVVLVGAELAGPLARG